MLRFEDHEDFFEINLASQETADLPSRGDAYLNLRLASAGFAGHNDLWVLADSLRFFCAALVALERTRNGEAVLVAIAPEELTLKVSSVDSRGHLAIADSVGYYVERENSRPWHAVHFGFEFDPSQLERVITTAWVKRNADPKIL